MNTVITARTSPDLLEKLDRIAESMHRARSWLVNEALKTYVENNSWQVEAIEQGMKSARLGTVVAHDEIAKWLGSWGSENEKDPPVCR